MNLSGILLGSENPAKLVEFYEKLFDSKPGWEGGDFNGWGVGNGYLTIGPHDKVKGQSKEPERQMMGFETDDVQSEFDRIKELGAKVIAEPYQPGEAEGMWIATFADPDGNYFQITTPMSEAM